MWIPPGWLFPVTVSASLSARLLGCAAVVASGLFILRRRRASFAVIALVGVSWLGLQLAQPAWQRVALADGEPHAVLESPPFLMVAPGVEVCTYRLVDNGEELERVDLVRLDPSRHRFSVATSPDEPRTIEGWRDQLSSVAVINGSYFLPDLTPQTPLRSDGKQLGPARYTSTHAAFVADADHETVAIVDLAGVELPRGLTPFREAMVSYPLLLASDGTSRAEGSHDWLASRTFVGIDRRGWVVFGTTHHGFFSLRRLARFLREAPLQLETALNLDGGPIAAQAVRAGTFDRVTVGDAETNAGNDLVRARLQATRHLHVPLPIVLAALSRS